MKIKSTSLLAAAGSLALLANANAALYLEDFSSGFTDNADVVGQTGVLAAWSGDPDVGYTYNTPALGVGGFTTPGTLAVGSTLPSGWSITSADPAVTTSFSTSFYIQDSNNASRDTFGFTVLGASASNLFSLVLTPVSQPNVAEWGLSWTSDFGSGATYAFGLPLTGTGIDATSQLTGTYTPVVTFVDNGLGGVDFELSIASQTFSGTLGTLSPSAAMVGFEFFTDSSGSSNNQMFVTEISAIPEPSSAMLIGLGAAGLMFRRKRA